MLLYGMTGGALCAAWMLGASAALAGSMPSPVVVDFETLTPGTTFGPSQIQNGDLILTEDGVDVSLATLIDSLDRPIVGSFTVVNVEPPGPAPSASNAGDFGDGIFLSTGNGALSFDLSDLAFDVRRIRFQFSAAGGAENVGVNGLDPFIGFLGQASGETIAPGVTLTVSFDFDRSAGVAQIDSDTPLTSFLWGGQESAIDTVTFIPSPGGAAVAAMALLGAGARRRR